MRLKILINFYALVASACSIEAAVLLVSTLGQAVLLVLAAYRGSCTHIGASSMWQAVLLMSEAYRGSYAVGKSIVASCAPGACSCAVGTYNCTLKQAVTLLLAAYRGSCAVYTYIEVSCAVGASGI
jgi:hypothetical protein